MNQVKLSGFVRSFDAPKDIPQDVVRSVLKGEQVDFGKYGIMNLKEGPNGIEDDLKHMLAYQLAGSQDYALDNLASASSGGDTSLPGTITDNDGIFYSTSIPAAAALDTSRDIALLAIFKTTKNAGGDKTTPYIEFYGELDGAFSNTGGYLILGRYLHTPIAEDYEIGQVYASKQQDISIDSGRKFFVYWKISFS